MSRKRRDARRKRRSHKTKEPSHKRTIVILLALAAIGSIAFASWSSIHRNKQHQSSATQSGGDSKPEIESTVRGIVSSEELILELTPRLRSLSKSVSNLQLPDTSAKLLFADQVKIIGRLTSPTDPRSLVNGISSRSWTVSDESEVISANDLALWNRLFTETDYLENGRFYFVKGSFAADTFEEFNSVLGFSGLAKHRDGRIASWNAKINVDWTRGKTRDQNRVWRITSWALDSFDAVETATPFFVDVLESAVTDELIFSRATLSRQEQMTSDLLAGKHIDRRKDDNYPFFFAEVTLEHPGISVVDIDDDGFDDVFVAMQHDANLLFRNKGDGTFDEVAEQYGLNLTGPSTSAIFADFDNDGDPDLFLGRARHRSLYLVNEAGSFVDRSKQLVSSDLPYMVSSISAADFNGDGLLDVYLSTYSPIEAMHRFTKETMPIWARQYLSTAEFDEFKKQISKMHAYLGRPGPPNMLLVNAGNGRFEVATENASLQLWRKSFQASWTDFDSDGDPDLYVANDYGPDNFFRNDSPHGFTDITQDVGLDLMGFGMGVAWGDYDNDGQTDLYVSNMFSKAGQRITDGVAGIDPRFREMAAGNFLYRYADQKFSIVSGPENPSLQVQKAGWSWGGQFFDFNNDGFQDIYVASGFYTAPADVAVEIDL